MSDNFTAQDVENIANLASIGIDPNNIPKYAQAMTNTFQLIAELHQIDTDSVQPMSHPLDITQRTRDDVITGTNERDQLLADAPATEAGLFLVPKVIE